MTDFITLSCPSCRSKLAITQDVDRFACTYCGREHLVNRGEGFISLQPIAEGGQDTRRWTDKAASELAIIRLEKEIVPLSNELEKEKNAQFETAREEDRKRNREGCGWRIVRGLAYVVLFYSFFFIVLFIDNFLDNFVVSLVLGAASTAGLFYLAYIALNKASGIDKWIPITKEDMAWKEPIPKLENTLAQKQIELEEHKRIVSLGEGND